MWRGLESAPRDGTRILYAGKDWVTVGWWDVHDEGWYEVNNHPTDAWGGPDYPSHWKPLPAPPADEQGEL